MLFVVLVAGTNRGGGGGRQGERRAPVPPQGHFQRGLDPADAPNVAATIAKRMMKQSVAPDRKTYSLQLQAYMMHGDLQARRNRRAREHRVGIACLTSAGRAAAGGDDYLSGAQAENAKCRHA